MPITKHYICLSKNHYIESTKDMSANTFVFNTHTKDFNADWLKRNMVKNDGVFIIQDTNNRLGLQISTVLDKKNYFIINQDWKNSSEGIRINPFDVVHDTSEIHFLFTNFLFALWDNDDPDIFIMANLIDAFASAVFYLFDKNKSKRTMSTLVKMAESVNAVCTKDGTIVPMYEALFQDNPNPNWIPQKYYSQFVAASGTRKDEIAHKVLQFFRLFTPEMIQMMNKTDESISASLFFKTAFLLNANNDEEKAFSKIMLSMLIMLSESTEGHAPIAVVIDDLDAKHLLLGLPKWMVNSTKTDMDYLLFCDNLAQFKQSEPREQYFKGLQKSMNATLMVHRNKKAEKAFKKLSEEEQAEYHNTEYVATLVIPGQNNEEDEVF